MTHHPDFQSGNWTGFYLEPHRREPGWMHLYLDCDQDGVIRGEGIDYVGPWTLVGQFNSATKECSWTKSYVNRHRVDYDGKLGENGIVGQWNIGPFWTDQFHIWPESMNHLYEHYLRMGMPIPSAEPSNDSRIETGLVPAELSGASPN